MGMKFVFHLILMEYESDQIPRGNLEFEILKAHFHLNFEQYTLNCCNNVIRCSNFIFLYCMLAYIILEVQLNKSIMDCF